MKTEQEQIEKMARTMCGYCSTDGKCAVSKNLREPDICANVDTEHCLYKEYAERLIESGYGNISEYKAEIERLEQLNAIQCDAWQKLSDENERLVTENNSNLRYNSVLRKENKKLTEKVKQAQIDVLNRAKEKFNAISRVLADDSDIGADIDGIFAVSSCIRKIDELIKEVQNEN